MATPAKARRTGKPSPSKPRGEVVIERTGRNAARRGSTTVMRGRAMLGEGVTAGISRFITKQLCEVFRAAGFRRRERLRALCSNVIAAAHRSVAENLAPDGIGPIGRSDDLDFRVYRDLVALKANDWVGQGHAQHFRRQPRIALGH